MVRTSTRKAEELVEKAAIVAKQLLENAKRVSQREEPYTNRELEEKFANLSTLVREKHDDAMVRIGQVLVQTTTTNGTVKWTVKMIYLALGGLSVLTLVVVPLLSWSLLQIYTNSSSLAVLSSKVYTLTHPQ